MNHKENFRYSLECKPPYNKIPLWELEFHLWGKFSGKDFFVGEDFIKLTASEKDKAINTNAEIIEQVSEKLDFRAVTIPGSYWEIAPGNPAYWWLPEDYRIKQAAILQNLIGNKLMLVANTGGVLAMPSADNYLNFAYTLCESPDKINEMEIETFQRGIKSVNQFSDIGIQTFLTASDIADNSGPFFNPEQMERLILPFLERWSSHIKQLSGLSIIHSDGNLNLYIDRIINSGVNALQAIDPVAKMDINKVKLRAGDKLCICGNIDIGKLITNSPESIYNETGALLEYMNDKPGFVLGASNAIQNEVPVENYLALVDSLKDFN
jgi:uroporphyrinogen decarboxylase